MAKTAWVEGAPYETIGARSAKGASVAGTDDAPGDANGLGDDGTGLDLRGLEGFAVHIESSDGSTALTAGAKLLAYVQNPANKRWGPCPDLDLVAAGGSWRQSFPGFLISSGAGRLMYVPSGFAAAVFIYINGTNPRR
jgi:hypothetical protein